MASQQAHHFTSACQQPCCSELYVCRQKGPERAVGGQHGSACAARNELEPVAVVVARAPWFHSVLWISWHFYLFRVFSLFFAVVSCYLWFETFAVNALCPFTTQRHSKHRAVKLVHLYPCMTSRLRWIQWWKSAHYRCFYDYDWQSSNISVILL